MPISYNVPAIVATLERTPGVLRAMLAELPDETVRATEGGDSWSPFDVIGHLIHGEKTDWIPRLRIILTEGEDRPFDAFDRFAQLAASEGKSTDELLDEFEALRMANLEALAVVLAGGLDLYATGTHPDLGRVTAGELLSTWAAHDLGHIAQIVRVLARGFGSTAGPWKSYLSILGA
jgi:hypothetical protein